MTEKRFECMGNGYFVDNLEDADLDNREVVDVLNTLHEENEQLKQTVSDWSGSYDDLFEDVKRLEEENEQLKQYKQAVNDVLDSYYQRDLNLIEELLLGRIAKELNIDLHYKKR